MLRAIRGPKVLGMAVADIAGTVALAWALRALLERNGHRASLHAVLFATFVAGVVAHRVFGVDTMLGHYLGLNPLPSR